MNRHPYRNPGFALALAAGLCLACASTQTPPIDAASLLEQGEAPPPAHHFEHVLVIVLENQDFVAAANDPYLHSLAEQGAVFKDFHGLFHPSYANYLAMISGRLIKTRGDSQITVSEPTVGDRLKERNLDWKNYAEDYPGRRGDCFLGARSGKYARKHVPFLSFAKVQKEECDKVVPATELMKDLKAGTLPAYAFYSPNLDNDGHDPVSNPKLGLAKGSAGLKKVLDPILSDPALRKGTLVVVTFDESMGRNPDNRIYTVFLGDMIKAGTVNRDALNHFNVLRTIEDNFGLRPLSEDGDGRARPITAVWK